MVPPSSTLRREVKGIAGHGLVYMGAALASRCVGFLMIPLYTRYMETEDYGTLEMLDLVVQVTGMIFALGLANAAMRFHAQAEEERAKRRVVSTAHIAAICLSAVGSLLIFAASAPLAEELLDGRPVRLLWYVAGSTFGAGMAGIPLAYLRIQGRSVPYLAIALGQLVLAVTLNIVFVVGMGMQAEGVVLSGLISQTFWGAVLTVLLFRQTGIAFDTASFRKMARYGAPLLLSAAGTFLMTSGDRWFVKEYAGMGEVGLYGLAYRIGFLVQILMVGPFFLVWQPRAFAIEKDPTARPVYARVFTYFMAGLLFAASGLTAVAEDVMRLMTTPEFYAAHRFVPWIAFACVFNGVQVYCRIGLFLENRTEIAGLIMLGIAVLALAASLFATRAFGAMGAAVVTFGSYAAVAGAMALASRRLYAIPYEIGRLAKLLAAVAAVLLVAAADPFEELAPSLAWSCASCLAYPVVLGATRFLTSAERVLLLDRLTRLRARLTRAAADGGPNA